MQRQLLRFCVLLVALCCIGSEINAQQTDTIPNASVDPDLIAWKDATRVREYTISAIHTTGVQFLDTAIVVSISGLQVGQKFMHP
ncbi:MAG: hypothetical protein JNN29_10850, partial [Chitinophagaceae bacterium]|nr:hypothetical protein [Chitinophagaceae bacterium]